MGWKVNGSTSSNSVENTECIEVTGFPKYPYYPQYLTVSVYSPSTGVSVEKNIKLIDCNGDDNPCNGLSGKVVHNGSTPKILYNRVTTSMPVSIKVFDVLGKIVYNGSESDLNNIDLSVYTGILFYVYFDELGQPIKTEKRVYIK